ncbi:hypothetical protein EJM73_08825 [Clostridium botulinum]|uniref:hypothetical protein n=1 Tax=Clostridium botulinum TaxID=1491 RepID=UPI0013761983|nr:hypothetical protein [Clostridium botulinum]NCI19727.1 hypothetical protein [Clostridium botulinum]NCI35765.1 hypothetical protein [Clostridium botulinum]NCI71622.1 hypothetical protein [Clostridium botulinum]NDI38814.1 hypothetical protein [Clostridium botulinum]
MINILKWFKKRKKFKYERELEKFIDFNNYMTEKYKIYPKKIKYPIDKYEEETCICMCYSSEFLNKIRKKYNVDNKLIKEVLESEYIALEEKDNMSKRIKKINEEKETREKIDLYKRAILELKEKGKI